MIGAGFGRFDDRNILRKVVLLYIGVRNHKALSSQTIGGTNRVKNPDVFFSGLAKSTSDTEGKMAICIDPAASLARETRELPIPCTYVDLFMEHVVSADVFLSGC